MSQSLSADELVALVGRVFQPTDADRKLAIILDMPDGTVPDTQAWKERREMAFDWTGKLQNSVEKLGLDAVDLILYRNPRANNANLPAEGVRFTGSVMPPNADDMIGEAIRFEELFSGYQILIAPTQFSATAPLKMAAKKHELRAATMPGFSKAMIPALRLDYGIIGKRVDQIKQMLDKAVRCDLVFEAAGSVRELTLDLRHRSAHASGGVFPENGVAGNLPSGESYIVPYEGELDGDSSQTCGEMPVELDGEIVVYKVEDNRAVSVVSEGEISSREADNLKREPAYGNMAELGLGVLGDFGLEPTGEILLDEKLGLHIAFGRSEHFGGQVGPDAFSSPEKVVHIDRVYIPKIQPSVLVRSAVLIMPDESSNQIMKDGVYTIDFTS